MTFLDSHVEANLHWAEPILKLIKENYKTVVTPVIDVIDAKTMVYNPGKAYIPAVGTFNWGLEFDWKGGVRCKGCGPTDPVE